MKVETQLYLTDNQVATRFGISRNSIWRLVKTGQLPQPVRLFKNTIRWRLSDIEVFEAERAAAPNKSERRPHASGTTA